MFDIGFWEIALIAVVALLIVGPNEFPTVVRKAGYWFNKVRSYASSIKDEINQEINKADELKNLAAKELEIEALHKVIDESKLTVPINYAAGTCTEGSSENHRPVGNKSGGNNSERDNPSAGSDGKSGSKTGGKTDDKETASALKSNANKVDDA